MSITGPETIADAGRAVSLRFLVLDGNGTIVHAWGDWPAPDDGPGAEPGRPIFDLPNGTAGSARRWGGILRGVRAVLERRVREFKIGYNADPPDDDRRLAISVQPADEGAILTLMEVTGAEQAGSVLQTGKAEVDSVPWTLDLTTGKVTVDPWIKIWLGYPADVEDSPATWEGRFFAADLPLFKETLASLLTRELSIAQLETRLIDSSGRIRWFQVRASVIHREGASLPCVVGTARDITRLKAAETALTGTRRALKRRDRRLRSLMTALASARLSERKRIARELHDDVCQRLAALEIFCSVLLRRLDEPDAKLMLVEIMSRISALSKDVRHLTHEVDAPVMQSGQLLNQLRSYAHDLERIAHLRVDVETTDLPPTLPHGLAVTLFRVAQEGLRNVAQHARTHHARVLLSQEADGLIIQVQDEGRGFDPDETRTSAGFGITSMTERVAELAGHLQVKSTTGQGTTLRAWIPATLR